MVSVHGLLFVWTIYSSQAIGVKDCIPTSDKGEAFGASDSVEDGVFQNALNKFHMPDPMMTHAYRIM